MQTINAPLKFIGFGTLSDFLAHQPPEVPPDTTTAYLLRSESKIINHFDYDLLMFLTIQIIAPASDIVYYWMARIGKLQIIGNREPEKAAYDAVCARGKDFEQQLVIYLRSFRYSTVTNATIAAPKGLQLLEGVANPFIYSFTRDRWELPPINPPAPLNDNPPPQPPGVWPRVLSHEEQRTDLRS